MPSSSSVSSTSSFSEHKHPDDSSESSFSIASQNLESQISSEHAALRSAQSETVSQKPKARHRNDTVGKPDSDYEQSPKSKKPYHKSDIRALNVVQSIPDWQLVASSTGGTTPLVGQYLSNPEIDSLIGWATHICQDSPVENPNPLLGLPSSPLRPAELFLIHDAMNKFVKREKLNSLLQHEFDQSALVSLGFCLEEMMTASLLPLARAHVRRCQSFMEEKEAKEEKEGLAENPGDDEDDDVYSELTLPPEEAILKLRPQDMRGIDTVLPTSKPAPFYDPNTVRYTRSCKNTNEALKASIRWRQCRGIRKKFFDQNSALYGLIAATGSTQAKKKSSVASRAKRTVATRATKNSQSSSSNSKAT